MSAPLHQANMNAQPGQGVPSKLLQKGLLGAAGRGKIGSSIVSPTDNVLSPCSAKLSGAKQRHFQKGKPVSLTSQLSQLATSDSTSSVASAADKPKVDF